MSALQALLLRLAAVAILLRAALRWVAPRRRVAPHPATDTVPPRPTLASAFRLPARPDLQRFARSGQRPPVRLRPGFPAAPARAAIREGGSGLARGASAVPA